ncbi:MAG: glycosyltransferase [bacterium]|nr:glycosyltransferase [bacterium]
MELFEENLKILGKIDSWLARLLRVQKSRNRDKNIQLLVAKNKEYTCYCEEGEKNLYLHSSINPSLEAKRLIENLKSLENTRTIIILGLGLGYHIFELFKRLDAEQRIIIIEERIEFLYYSFCLFDWRKILLSNQINLIIARGVSRFDFIKDLFGKFDEVEFLKLKPSLKLFPGYYIKVEEVLNAALKKEIVSSKRVFSILSFISDGCSGLKYILEDALDGLLKNKQKVYAIDLNDYIDNDERLAIDFANHLEEIKPDFVFTIGGIGIGRLYEQIISSNIPYVTWMADNPLLLLKSKFKSDSNINIFVWDNTYVAELRNAGYKNVFYLPLATNPKIFKELSLSEEEKEYFTCEVSFAGTISDPYIAEMYQKYESLFYEMFTPEVVKEVIELQSLNPRQRIIDTLIQTQNKLGISSKNDQEYRAYLTQKVSDHLEVIDGIAMKKFRTDIIKFLSCFNINVYGDNEWKSFQGPGVVYKGYLDNRTQLPKLYNASMINLNLTISQSRTGVNMRVFDVASCGGFVLSDYTKDLESLFKIGEEVIVFREREELKKLVKYFIDNPTEKENIALNAKKRVLSEHTYTHRMNKFISILAENTNLINMNST